MTLKKEEQRKHQYIMEYIKKNKFIITVILIYILSTCINFYIKDYVYIILNENQILYTYATTAQVIGSLYALTLTGFIFFNDKLSKLFQEEESLYDVVERLKRQHFYQIILLGIGCSLTIIFSILALNIKKTSIYLFSSDTFYSFMLNQAMFFFLIEVISIIVFSINMLNPKNIERVNKQILDENKFKSEGKGNLELFLSSYNKMEKKVMELSETIYGQKTYSIWKEFKKNKNFRPGLLTALHLLKSLNVLTEKQVEEINEIRIYRNSVVHSDEPEVSKNAEDKIVSINTELDSIIEKNKEKYTSE